MLATAIADPSSPLLGRYVIERQLGRGGMATVYLAEDLKLGRRVALKLLHPDLNSALGPERFLREIAVASRLSHPHILGLHDSGEAEGRLFYAMPYVEGESLRQRLEREAQLPVEEAVRIVRAVAAALDYAHQAGVVHRDIKPENILLARDPGGGPAHPLVADFGLARALDVAGGQRLTETGLALGTPAYMSPEQIAGSSGVDARSDVYALGCVTYEMLAGAPPFTGRTAQAILARHAVDPVPPLRTVRSSVPPAVELAVTRALAKVPADRFATADEFADALLAESPSWMLGARAIRLSGAGTILGIAAAAAVGIGVLLLRDPKVPEASVVMPSARAIAVLPFVSPVEDTALFRLGRDLSTTVSATLNGVGGIETVDRMSVASATADRSPGSAADDAALARRLGARSVLRGTLVREGGTVRIDLGLLDAESLEPVVKGITVTGRRDSLRAMTDSIVWALLRQVWQRGEAPSTSLDAVTTRSLSALRAFLDGEQWLETNRPEEAMLAYRSAIATDSSFWLAHFRLATLQAWNQEDVEPGLLDILRSHRDVFSERDRLLIDVWTEDSLPLRLELGREAVRRFPDYWPAWLALGDALHHGGPRLGYGWGETQAALNRALSLNPRLRPALMHLWQNSVARDAVESQRVLDRLLAAWRAEPARNPGIRLGVRATTAFARAGGRIGPELDALADSLSALDVGPTGGWGPFSLLYFGYPAAQIDVSRRALRLRLEPGVPEDLLRGMAWSWAARGGWDSALATMATALQVQAEASREGEVTPLEQYGLAVLGVWLGALVDVEALSRRPAAEMMVTGLGTGAWKTEALATLGWLDGMLAFSRRDRSVLGRAREAVRRSGHSEAALVDRSLDAFDRALAGDPKAAAHQLVSLEWHCAAFRDCREDHLPDIAVNRLAAATWLLEAGDSAQAARLLLWHEAGGGGWEWSFTYATTALAYLMLARIEEARGDARLAITHYRQFLRRYDMPMPGQRHLVDEAQSALERLAGPSDATATE